MRDTKVLSIHSSLTCDLTRLLYHLWFTKPHTHISYSQYLLNVLTFTATYENIRLWKGYLLSFVVSYRLFVFFNNANVLRVHKCEHVVFEIMCDTKVLSSHSSSTRDLRLAISKTPYSHFLLTVFSQCYKIQSFKIPFLYKNDLHDFYLQWKVNLQNPLFTDFKVWYLWRIHETADQF